MNTPKPLQHRVTVAGYYGDMDCLIQETAPGRITAMTPCCDATVTYDEFGTLYCKGCFAEADPIHAANIADLSPTG